MLKLHVTGDLVCYHVCEYDTLRYTTPSQRAVAIVERANLHHTTLHYTTPSQRAVAIMERASLVEARDSKRRASTGGS